MIRTLAAADSLESSRYLSTRCAWNPLAVFDSECWASTYEALQYGRITRPGDVAPPRPLAPQTADEMTRPGAWGPDDGTDSIWADYAARLRAQIEADEAAGDYDPAGNLPFTATEASEAADFWTKYKYFAIAAGGIVACAFVMGMPRGIR